MDVDDAVVLIGVMEHQNGLRGLFLDHIGIWQPHVAADAFKLGCALLPEPREKSFQRLLGAAFAAPQQTASLKVVNIGDIYVAPLAGDLVY